MYSYSLAVGRIVHVTSDLDSGPCDAAIVTAVGGRSFSVTVIGAAGAQRENGIYRTTRSADASNWHPADRCPVPPVVVVRP